MSIIKMAKEVMSRLNPKKHAHAVKEVTREPTKGISDDLYIIYIKAVFKDKFETMVELLNVFTKLNVKKRHRLMVYAFALSNESNFVDMWNGSYAHECIDDI